MRVNPGMARFGFAFAALAAPHAAGGEHRLRIHWDKGAEPYEELTAFFADPLQEPVDPGDWSDSYEQALSRAGDKLLLAPEFFAISANKGGYLGRTDAGTDVVIDVSPQETLPARYPGARLEFVPIGTRQWARSTAFVVAARVDVRARSAGTKGSDALRSIARLLQQLAPFPWPVDGNAGQAFLTTIGAERGVHTNGSSLSGYSYVIYLRYDLAPGASGLTYSAISDVVRNEVIAQELPKYNLLRYRELTKSRGAEFRIRLACVPNDPFPANMLPTATDAQPVPPAEAPPANPTPNGPLIGLVDTGIDWEHPGLAPYVGNRWERPPPKPGWPLIVQLDFVDRGARVARGADVADAKAARVAGGHGTHSAYVILSSAPRARLMDLRAVDGRNHGDAVDVAVAIHTAVAQNADIICLSIASQVDSPLIRAALRRAIRDGCVVLVAAGNYGTRLGVPGGPRFYPACYGLGDAFLMGADRWEPEHAAGGMVVVGAFAVDPISNRLHPWGASNHDGPVTVLAPGVGVLGADVGGMLTRRSGTSCANASLAGLVADRWTSEPSTRGAMGAKVQRLIDGLVNSSDPTGRRGHPPVVRSLPIDSPADPK